MLIGIDGNEANVDKRVGIGEFAYELLEEFYKLRSEKIRFEIFLKNSPSKDFPKEDSNWKYKLVRPSKLWTQIGLPLSLFLSRNKPDVFFTPTHYAPRFSPIPGVVSVMDLSYVHFSSLFNKDDLYQLTNWTRYSVRKSKKVITISNSSKGDIIKEYKVPEEKVEVIYPGLKPTSKAIASMSDVKSKYNLSGKYILFLGTIQPRKNIKRLIEAFSRISPKHPDLILLIAGKKGWLYEETLKTPADLGISEQVKFLDFVADTDLPALYKNAEFFILPSLYEGFGLPVLEAMKYDCPVITSNVSSLPEAGGDAALYVDPESAEDIADKMEKLLSDPGLREELIKKGKNQVNKFSWEKAAKETLRVLEDVAGA